MAIQETTSGPAATQLWYAKEPSAVVSMLGTDEQSGLAASEAEQRQARYGPNAIASERPPSAWAVALRLLRDPMNLMLVGVVVVSLLIDQIPVGIVVALLVVLNLVLGTQQELKARASVDALAKMQIPQARVIRGGSLVQLDATQLVPGDIVNLEAGDLVPADGRLLRSATLETQEAALTGESAPIAKDPKTLEAADVALGDRTNMIFQNTAVTRGTATMVVTETGMQTEMGKIASMLSAVEPGKSPLQRELDGLTKVIGIIAWAAVAVIIIIGVVRGQALGTVLLVGMSMAIAAIPTGMPTFVQAMLAYGAKQLAEHKAVVKNLSDVETLGATSAINSDKTGTLTMNQMMVRELYIRGNWYNVQGDGYAKTGAIRQKAGEPVPDFTQLAYGLCLDSDATVSDSGEVIGDPTEAALVVLAAKMGVDAETTRRAYPRVAEVPFDSAYKFMATFHHLQLPDGPHFVELVKGGPDVVLARCTKALQPDGPVDLQGVRGDITEANESLSRKGLRVLAFAFRILDGRESEVTAGPMGFVEELVFVGMVGIIDPLRSEAAEAVRTAHEAGIDVRMITGDHAITAAAIGAELKLGPGAISGPEIQAMSDEDLVRALPRLHVFGRVTPQDKLRLARLMQQGGDVVAMTGDAVNDAAALKQADVGVAMGSGSEVTKQAGNMILTDDNFGTLVSAIRLGRSIYDKVVSFVRYQMSALFALVLLFLTASIFNINQGVALTPTMVLFINFFITIFPVIVIMTDPPAPDLMSRPPRDTSQPITNGGAVTQWLVYGVVGFAVTLAALLLAPGPMSATEPNVPLTMAFVVLALSSIFGALAKRRDPESGLSAPIISALKILSIPVLFTVAAVEIGFLQNLLLTTSLSGGQWLACIGLALIVPIVVELDKAIRRSRTRRGSAAVRPVAEVVGGGVRPVPRPLT
ncbi:cation-transporting P-type ATPase [Arthrobacter sp. I2-34]|uniref:Cation-transporting P-type ATPase n=1 Tax=Arthrobacter hankyongi TaxID=2904801 RepID=A0ABS9LE01_9MICC|nr:cation-transporting P-type ATPase [Arthrobacter hankyongi]MCG2624895.1 cation-transporting P-type ATPase [Arthrobacter hankyongi]